jgi:tripartite-type tricarboxylate transporter receptor subunit TctC
VVPQRGTATQDISESGTDNLRFIFSLLEVSNLEGALHMKKLQIILAFVIVLAVFKSIASGQDFYANKTIRIVVGFSPGGGMDIYARAIGRHLGKNIPGKPTVIVENMPGAGSLIAANYLFKQAKPDGLTIGS